MSAQFASHRSTESARAEPARAKPARALNGFAISHWFLAAIAVIPLVYSSSLLEIALTPRAILLAIVTAIAIVVTWREAPRLSSTFLVYAAYAVLTILSLGVALNTGEALFRGSLVLLCGAWFFAALQISPRIPVPVLMRTLTALTLALGTITVFQLFGLGFGWIPGGDFPYATMTMKNLLSSFLFLVLPAAFYVAVTDTAASWRWTAAAAITLTSFVLLITQTRAVWLACITAVAVSIAAVLLSWRYAAEWQQAARRLIATAGGVAACLILIFGLNVGHRPRAPQLSAAEKVGSVLHYISDTSALMRLTVWKHSLAMLTEHPLLGVGMGNWKIQIPKYGLGDFPPYVQNGSEQWSETHNDFLATFCETGFGGGVAYLLLFIVAAAGSIRWLGRSQEFSENLLATLTIATVAGFAVISFFDFPRSHVEHMMVFLLWLALIPSTRYGLDGHNWVKPLALACIVPGLVLSIYHYSAETHEHAVLQARFEQDWDKALQESDAAYSPTLLSLDALTTPILYYRAEARFMQGDFPGALRDNLAALEAHPYHFYTLNNTASCYVRTGNFEVAKGFYKRALAISPRFEESLINLASVYYNERKFDSASMYIALCDTNIAGSRAQSVARVVRSALR